MNKYRVEVGYATKRGGVASEWNLAVACGPCNQAKGSMTAEEFIAATNAIGKAG